MELISTDDLSNSSDSLGLPPTTEVLVSLAYQAHPNQESANSPLPLVCLRPPLRCFFRTVEQLSGRYPGQSFQSWDARRTNEAKHMDWQPSKVNS